MHTSFAPRSALVTVPGRRDVRSPRVVRTGGGPAVLTCLSLALPGGTAAAWAGPATSAVTGCVGVEVAGAEALCAAAGHDQAVLRTGLVGGTPAPSLVARGGVVVQTAGHSEAATEGAGGAAPLGVVTINADEIVMHAPSAGSSGGATLRTQHLVLAGAASQPARGQGLAGNSVRAQDRSDPVAADRSTQVRGRGVGMPSGGESEVMRDPVFALIEEMNFAGGSVSDYIDTVYEAAGLSDGGPTNLVVEEVADRAFMPPVALRDATVTAALTVINDLNLPVLVVDPTSSVIVVTKRAMTTETRVWDLSDLTREKWSAEDILSAVETTLDMQGVMVDSDYIRFHEPTNLLIARLDSVALRAIEQVIETLFHSQRRNDVSQRMTEQLKQQEQRLADALAQREEAAMIAEQRTLEREAFAVRASEVQRLAAEKDAELARQREVVQRQRAEMQAELEAQRARYQEQIAGLERRIAELEEQIVRIQRDPEQPSNRGRGEPASRPE